MKIIAGSLGAVGSWTLPESRHSDGDVSGARSLLHFPSRARIMASFVE
jgi:hypothetical protein